MYFYFVSFLICDCIQKTLFGVGRSRPFCITKQNQISGFSVSCIRSRAEFGWDSISYHMI